MRAYSYFVCLGVLGTTLACSGSSGSDGGAGSGGQSGSGGQGGSGTGSTAGTGAVAGSSGAGAQAGAGGSHTGGAAGAGATAGSGGAGAAGGSGGSGGSTGVESCSNKLDDDGDGFIDCDDTDCFADGACIASDLASNQMAGFTECGTPVTFTVADSDMTCANYSFGFFATKCNFASYTGTVSFYCPPKPKTDQVGLRWVVHSEVPFDTVKGKPVLWQTLGGDYAYGSSGGSAQNPFHMQFDVQSNGASSEDFVAYDLVPTLPSDKANYTNWFALWDQIGQLSPQISGGFVVEIDKKKLFGTQ